MSTAAQILLKNARCLNIVYWDADVNIDEAIPNNTASIFITKQNREENGN
jgi:hypothetical protein